MRRGLLRAAKHSARRAAEVAGKSNRASAFHRLLRCEPLEDRRILDVSAANRYTPPQHGIAIQLAVSGYTSPYGLNPSELRTAYGISSIIEGDVTGNGSGQTIAIVDAYDDPKLCSSTDPDFATSDLHEFDLQFGLPDPPSFTKLDQNGGTNYPTTAPRGPGSATWESEEAQDVEWAHVIAPQANIVLIEAQNDDPSNLISDAVNTARNVTGVSVISMSFGWTESYLSSFFGLVNETQYDATFTTPSGHNGVTFVASSGDNGSPGCYPAYSPNVLAVGGTFLSSDTSGNYVSETGWNDGGYSSGGGVSTYETEPTFQLGVQKSGQRTIPDVASDADQNPVSAVAVYDSYDCGASTPWTLGDGTSLSAPCWAGLIAIAVQLRAAHGVGSLDGPSETLPALYSLPSTDFHDNLGGNNGTNTNGLLDPAEYDEVTGLGSPIANKLVPDLANYGVITPTVDSFSVTATTLTAGASVQIQWTVSDEFGAGLKQVELWRAPDAGGVPGDWGTAPIQTYTGLSGAGPVGDYFVDTPSVGTWWYGIHVVDQNGVYSTEQDAGFSPAAVTVNPGTLEVSRVTPSAMQVLKQGQSVAYTITVDDGIGNPVSGATVNVDDGVQGTCSSPLTTNGSFTNQGTVEAAATGATLNLYGTWTNAGTIVATAGTVNLEGQFMSSGQIDCTGGMVEITGTLNNAGTITHAANGLLTMQQGSTLNNMAGALYNMQGNVQITGNFGGTINNAGTFWKSAGTGTSTISNSIAFNNTGTVEVDSGTLIFGNGPAPLTVTPDNQVKTYGDTFGAFTGSIVGIENGDNITATYASTGAAAGAAVSGSPYTITTTLVDPTCNLENYTVTVTAGSLTVIPAVLTITANSQTKVYGAALPSLTASYAGFVNGDTSASLTTQPALSTTAAAASHVLGSPYTITAGGAADADYTISYVGGSLTVTQASLTITATAASHVSGSPYTITAGGAADTDYTISYVGGSLTVTQAPLTITANGQTKVYGAALPTLTASYSGFVNGDTSGSLTAQPTLGTTATAASCISGNPYTITAGGAADADYTISYTSGTLSVLPDPTTVGVFNSASSAFFLKNSCCPGAADATVPYGPPGAKWEPIVGDWMGNGVTTLGLYNPATSTFFLKDSNSSGAADMTFNYGPGGSGWTPLIGGWTCPTSGSPDLSRAPGVAPMLVNAGATGSTTAAPAPGIDQAIAAGGAGSAGVVGQDFQSHWQIESYPAAALSQTADTQLVSGVGTGSASLMGQDLEEHGTVAPAAGGSRNSCLRSRFLKSPTEALAKPVAPAASGSRDKNRHCVPRAWPPPLRIGRRITSRSYFLFR
jgi:hypothetical protein